MTRCKKNHTTDRKECAYCENSRLKREVRALRDSLRKSRESRVTLQALSKERRIEVNRLSNNLKTNSAVAKREIKRWKGLYESEVRHLNKCIDKIQKYSIDMPPFHGKDASRQHVLDLHKWTTRKLANKKLTPNERALLEQLHGMVLYAIDCDKHNEYLALKNSKLQSDLRFEK